MFIYIILIILGFLLLIKGADFLINGSAKIAKKFHISEMMIGLTIVAMGTSMPEFVVSLTSAIEGHSDISLGNVIGSNLANLLLILGICAMLKKGIEIKKETRTFENPFNLFITFILLVLCLFGGQFIGINKVEGGLLLLIFAIYLGYIILTSRKNAEHQPVTKKEKDISIWKSILLIIIGIIGLKYGADFVVNNSIKVAEIMGISEKIIGLTIVAIGTSLPELVASVTAIRKGEDDLAIGNILGSNIFNILLILGVSAVISPITYNVTYNLDIVILFLSSLLLSLYAYIGKKNELTKLKGFIFVAIYIIYILTLLVIR